MNSFYKDAVKAFQNDKEIIEIPKNATNGEVLKALFSVETEDNFHNSYGIRINESNYFQLNKDWWNKPYKES